MPVPDQNASTFFKRSAMAKACATKTAHTFYTMGERDIESLLDCIRCGISEKVTSWGRLHIHHAVWRTESVYCAYDASLSRIGFFIRPEVGALIVDIANRD
jgi:hypothetical protein